MLVEIKDEIELEELISKNEKPILVDFWAPWCGPCKLIGPKIKSLSEELKNEAVIAKVNVDDNSEIASKYGIRNIPTIIYFENGEIKDKSVGIVNKEVMKEKLGLL